MSFNTTFKIGAVLCVTGVLAACSASKHHDLDAGSAPDAGSTLDAGGSSLEDAGGSTSAADGGSDAGAIADADAGVVAATVYPSDCKHPGAYTHLVPATEGIPATGLALWLRADVGVAVDAQNRVCVWEDQTRHRRDVKQDMAAARPKARAKLGGKAAIDIDPGQSLLRSDVLGMAPTSARTILAVYALDTAGTRFTLGQADPTTNWEFLTLDDNTYETVGNRYGCYETSQSYDGEVTTDLKPHVRVLRADSMTPGLPVSKHLECSVDGADLTLTYRCCDATQVIGDFSTANTTFVPQEGDAKLAEVLFYDHALSAADLKQAEQALSKRYGITVK